jgi:ferrous iron transport protein A
MTISQLKCGERATIKGFLATAQAYKHKLLAMGLTPGTVFTLSRVAPLGDPIQIQVRGYSLSLRKQEAMVMQIEKVDV